MKTIQLNIQYTVKNNLCLGCGICSDACPTGSITMQIENGEYRPSINLNTCINSKGCHKCSNICPGVGIKLLNISKEKLDTETIKEHTLIGRYEYAYSGYALDYETRFHGASGGILTSFIAFLLDKKYISAAVVAENNVTQPFLNRTVLIHDSKDLYKARSSKYCPVKYDEIVPQVKKENGKVVIVGLPCIIQGYRKYEQSDFKFKDKIFGYFGLYCSCGRSFNLTEYVFKSRGVDSKNLTYFQYRDEGCLGYMVAKEKRTEKDGNTSDTAQNSSFKVTKEPFQGYYHPLRSFFIPHRCLLCIDHYAELADVSFGDIHYGKYKADKVGVNSIVVRNKEFDKILKDAAMNGYLTLSDLSEDELVKCQASAPLKKERTGGVLKFRKMIGLKNPEYDVTLSKYVFWKSVAYYIFAQCQRFVGRRKSLWGIIRFMYKKQVID